MKINKFLEAFIDNGGYHNLLLGFKNTMMIAVYGLIIGIVIGTLIATVKVMPKNKLLPRILDKLGSFYVTVFRGTPMVVQLLVAYYVILPLMGLHIEALYVAITVFGMNSGAYVSEIMRGGILSVDPGQMEGGRSVGLSYGTTMLKIVIPQAVKNILPTLGNEFITLVKETSVASFIAVMDIYKIFNDIGTNNYEFMIPYLAMAVIYIVIICIISLCVKLMERSLRKSDRAHK